MSVKSSVTITYEQLIRIQTFCLSPICYNLLLFNIIIHACIILILNIVYFIIL